jgi:hypothetical protein
VLVRVYLFVIIASLLTWCLPLREERRLNVFENRMLRRIGPKRDEVTGGWRELDKGD